MNHLELWLWDRMRWYSYRVSVSVDGETYDDIVDYSEYRCRSYQNLYFPTRFVQYIRLIGNETNSIDHLFFNIVGLKAMISDPVPRMVNGIIEPSGNVATIENGARVVSGKGSDNMLKAGHDYTFHSIGNQNGIIVQLNQPYRIGSLRLFVGTHEFPSDGNSFMIQTSLNEYDWNTVVDQRNKNLSKSWYNFKFEDHTVIYIKILGTKGANNVSIHFIRLEKYIQFTFKLF